MTTLNPTLVGERTPTPVPVYEPRIWKARVWVKGGPFEGVGVTFKAPYGVAMNASLVLTRAAARWQITRYSMGPVAASEMKGWTKADRAKLMRYEDAFAVISTALHIDWEA